ncbi:hypothetical protein, partial [Pseudomonas aeruginosa]|uniref:hypothetical protein n=1 Tax=Pseudomonas aeruginosa TaxID=287 RepID=UPI001CBB1CC4
FDNSATDLSFLRREHASGKLALASKSLISSFSHKSRLLLASPVEGNRTVVEHAPETQLLESKNG